MFVNGRCTYPHHNTKDKDQTKENPFIGLKINMRKPFCQQLSLTYCIVLFNLWLLPEGRGGKGSEILVSIVENTQTDFSLHTVPPLSLKCIYNVIYCDGIGRNIGHNPGFTSHNTLSGCPNLHAWREKKK